MIKAAPTKSVTRAVTGNQKRNAKSNAGRQAAFRARKKAASWEPPEILIGECHREVPPKTVEEANARGIAYYEETD